MVLSRSSPIHVDTRTNLLLQIIGKYNDAYGTNEERARALRSSSLFVFFSPIKVSYTYIFLMPMSSFNVTVLHPPHCVFILTTLKLRNHPRGGTRHQAEAARASIPHRPTRAQDGGHDRGSRGE
jgi:hypothetical protein